MKNKKEDLMTAEMARIEVDKLVLSYNVIEPGEITKHTLKSSMVMSHNFDSIASMYNKGRRFSKTFSWDNRTSISLQKISDLYKEVPADAKLYVDFARDDNGEGDYDDVTEFVWYRPYVSFPEFYNCNEKMFYHMLDIVKRDHQVYSDFSRKLNKKK
jgi:hypothetical protein